jgi:thiamine-phosphate pyrophosphorylase
MKQSVKGLYLVTDTTIQQRFTHEDLAGRAIRGGVDVIQLRDKITPDRELLEIARTVVRLCLDSGVISIINNRADIALIAGADGVHLGQNDMPLPTARELMGDDKIIGGTASTLEEALEVERQGADYVGFGHIFETTTKNKDYPPRGLEVLQEVTKALSIPVVAIGGINAENIGSVMEAGAAAAALSSAVCAADDPCKAAKALKQKVGS